MVLESELSLGPTEETKELTIDQSLELVDRPELELLEELSEG